MASSISLCLLLVAVVSIVAGAANEYKVGDNDGWRVPADPGFYETWASKIKFIAGDSIVFEYGNNSVVKVSKRGYYHCNDTSMGSFLKDGRTTFLLDKPGPYYFVSGDEEHCKKGQRLMVVAAGAPLPPLAHAPSPDPSSAASSPASPPWTAGIWCLSAGLVSF